MKQLNMIYENTIKINIGDTIVSYAIFYAHIYLYLRFPKLVM